MASKNNSSVKVYKEGLLLKRSRGLHSNKHLKFQERYCRLTSKSLDYYDPKKMKELKGQFRLGSIRIVEILPHGTFGEKFKSHPFQVGDNSEVMYFAAKTPQERNDWMDAFRFIAREKTNSMLSTYHPGVYGLHVKERWSCCGRTLRECDGCMNAVGTMKALGMDITTPAKAKPRSYTTPLELDGSTPSPENVSLAMEKSSLSESVKSDASDSTVIEPEDDTTMRRTYTICTMDRPSSQKSVSSNSTLLARTTPSPDSGTSGSIEENGGESSSPKPPKSPRPLPTEELRAIPNDLQTQDGATRSGASSPALSTDSGRGTSNSRPNSMIDHSTSTESLPGNQSRSESFSKRSNLSVIQDETGKMSENEQGAPLTPKSIKSNITTDSDRDSLGPTKSFSVEGNSDGQRRHGDCMSIISDVSNLSGYSTLSHPSHHNVRRRPDRSRPMSYCREWTTVSMIVDRRDSDGSFVESATNKLHQACKDGNLPVVRDELDTGAPVCGAEVINGLPMLPLFIAFLHDHWEVMKYLLKHEADPNAIDITTRSCLLHQACQRGCTDVVQLLIDYKADVNMRNHEECTPLGEASKNGHLDIVEILLDNGASVDSTGANNQTALHFAAAAGHEDVVELLLSKEANPLKKTSKNQMPYDLAYSQGHTYVMAVLQEYLPKELRAYRHRHSTELPSCQTVSSLCFLPDKNGSKRRLMSGSWDCTATVWNDSSDNGLTIEHQFKLSNTVVSISCHSHFVAMGFTSVQLTNVDNFEWRRTVADDSHEDESLEDPPLHLVSYSPSGNLVSAGVESNVVKIWPPTSSSDAIPQPTSSLTFKDKKGRKGCIYRLATSPCASEPWLAVVIQPGPVFSPYGSKKIHVYNLEEKKVYHAFDAGYGGTEVGVHVAFTPNGRFLVIGCKDKIVKWENSSGQMVKSFTLEKGDEITSLLYSPNGVHLAVGLRSGKVKILDGELQSTFFVLQQSREDSSVTSLAYSEDGSVLATGHCWGAIHLWNAMP